MPLGCGQGSLFHVSVDLAAFAADGRGPLAVLFVFEEV